MRWRLEGADGLVHDVEILAGAAEGSRGDALLAGGEPELWPHTFSRSLAFGFLADPFVSFLALLR